MRKIKRITPSSLAKLFGLLYAVFGLVAGLLIFIISLVGKSAAFSAVISVIFIVVLPCAYGLLGLIGGYIIAWLYNFVASKTGGLEFEIE